MATKAPRVAMKHPRTQIKERWWRSFIKGGIVSVVFFLLGAIIGQPLLALLWSPHAEVGIQGLQMNYCMTYNITFGHKGSIDSANFNIRFPTKLNGAKAGIAENIGPDEEHYIRPVFGDLDTNACAMMSGGNALDTTGVTTSIV